MSVVQNSPSPTQMPHVLFPHGRLLQQSLVVLHEPPDATQLDDVQTPLQVWLQHWLAELQLTLSARQGGGGGVHTPKSGSQLPLQH